jgi:predicted DNA-binding transcriptional regulator YafY
MIRSTSSGGAWTETCSIAAIRTDLVSNSAIATSIARFSRSWRNTADICVSADLLWFASSEGGAMGRSNRMFEVIQVLRSARKPLTALAIAERLEVHQRTIYRDIAALQAMRIPIEGEAGIGYVMRRGFDLPPLMFDADEVEAIVVGLALLRRTGDAGLQRAAASVGTKIAEVLPQETEQSIDTRTLLVSTWGASVPGIDMKAVRRAIREERKIRLGYLDAGNQPTQRIVRPIALVYYVEVAVLAAWCELRDDFRHFRVDRIASLKLLSDRFAGDGNGLRALWEQTRPA